MRLSFSAQVVQDKNEHYEFKRTMLRIKKFFVTWQYEKQYCGILSAGAMFFQNLLPQVTQNRSCEFRFAVPQRPQKPGCELSGRVLHSTQPHAPSSLRITHTKQADAFYMENKHYRVRVPSISQVCCRPREVCLGKTWR